MNLRHKHQVLFNLGNKILQLVKGLMFWMLIMGKDLVMEMRILGLSQWWKGLGIKNLKERAESGIKVQETKQIIKEQLGGKLSFRKEGLGTSSGIKEGGTIFRLGRKSSGGLSGWILLDPKHHSMGNLKENRSPNVSVDKLVESLGFSNLIEPSSLPMRLKTILTKDRLKIGEARKDPSMAGMDFSIPIE